MPPPSEPELPPPAPGSAATASPGRRPDGRRLHLAGALAALVYLALSLPLLGDFGPTWDVAIGTYPYGEALLAWWEHDGPETFVEFTERGLAAEHPVAWRQPYLDIDGRQFQWFKVYPVGALATKGLARILWHQLGLVGPLVAHHLFAPLSTALLVWLTVVFVGRRTSLAAALAGVALMVASPRFFTHALTNVKDSPETVLYTLAMFAVYRCVLERTAWTWVLLGVSTALTLAQKANGLFVPYQAGAILLAGRLCRAGVGVRWSAAAWGALAFLAVYLGVSPALWPDPLGGVAAKFGWTAFISNVSALDAVVEPQRGWMESLSPPLNAVVTTPIPVLVLAAAGLLTRAASPFLRAFLAIGVLFPQARLLLPGTRDFDGVRHFLEFYPSLCALAGVGLVGVVGRLRGGVASARAVLVATALAVLPGAWGLVATYPYGVSYFNELVGGLGGAQRRGIPQATDYWGASYWEGVRWLNEHAEPGAGLRVPVAGQVVAIVAPLRLREDLRLDPELPLGEVSHGDAPTYVMSITRREFYGPVLRWLEAEVEPVHEVSVQGGVILRIWRLAGELGDEHDRRLLEERMLQRAQREFVRWVLADDANAERVRAVMALEIGGDRAAAVAAWRELFPLLSEEQAGAMIEWLLERKI